MHVCMYVCIYTYTYMYVYTQSQTHRHRHTNTHIRKLLTVIYKYIYALQQVTDNLKTFSGNLLLKCPHQQPHIIYICKN
jgi:hypothetical protein